MAGELEPIAERGRALLGARGLAILLRQGPGLVAAATAGEVPAGVAASSRDATVASLGRLGLEPDAALSVPLFFRGRTLGLLVAFGGPALAADRVRLLAGFVATEVAVGRAVEPERLRDVILGAEDERSRWARELHDETLQGMGALRLVLASGRRSHDPERLRAAVDEAIEQLEQQIDGLRSLIRDLRPAALDQLGPQPAIEDLAGRTAARTGVAVSTRVALERRHAPEIEATLYRVIQEALANAVRHAGAEHVDVDVTDERELITVHVADDGVGFDPAARTPGFGLAVLRERVGLLDGSLEVASAADGAGTCVTAVLPAGAG